MNKTSFLLSLFVEMSLTIHVDMLYHKHIKLSNYTHYFQTDFFLSCLLVFFLYQMFKKYRKEKIHPLKWLLSFLFAIFMVLGKSYEEISSWNYLFGSFPLFLVSLCQIFSYAFLFKNIFVILDQYLKREKSEQVERSRKKIVILFQKNPFLFSLIILFLFWTIYFVAFYPLILSNDPSFQIKQFFNVKTKYVDYIIPLSEKVHITNHHPFLHTVLLGSFIQLGRVFGSDNFGLFLYAILQTITLASSFSFSISYLYKHQKNVSVSLFLLGIYALVPCFPFYAISAVKDTFYTAFLIDYVLLLFFFIEKSGQKQFRWFHSFFLLLLSLLISFFRNNGFYVIFLSFLTLILFQKKERFLFLSLFFLFLGGYFSYQKILLPSLKISNGSVREALSLPFQQTARYVVQHEKELTKKEKKVLDRILDYDTLKKRYNPILADPVKNKFNKYATKKELKNYFFLWFQQFLNHPTTYIQATLNNTYGYFYPNTSNWYFYYRYDSKICEGNLVNYHYNSFDYLRKILSLYGFLFPYIPVLGLLVNIGFGGMVLITLFVYLFLSTNRKYFIGIVPLYVSYGICFLSPANTYFRYSMPYLFFLPFLLLFFFSLIDSHSNI